MRYVIALIVVWTIAPVASGFDLKPDEIRGTSKKKNLSVLQNRYFLKTFRPEFGLNVGMILDEAYLNTSLFGARGALFVNEWAGLEVQYLTTDVSDSADRKAVESMRFGPIAKEGDATNGEVFASPEPEVNAIHNVIDVNGIFAPFYGKLNLLDQWIVYTDLYLTTGVSKLKTDQGEKQSITIGAGERFYVGKELSFRIDFRDRMFRETRAGSETTRHTLSVDLGTSWFFN